MFYQPKQGDTQASGATKSFFLPSAVADMQRQEHLKQEENKLQTVVSSVAATYDK